jgi:pimeloyl-ACP methyl ester carboxylesterase
MNPILHSIILGKGRPLVILHGFLGMLDNWKTLGNQYASTGLQVHLVDQRNHGHSFWSQEFHYDAMAEDLKAYFKYHGLAEAIVLGHSMGGKTAMHFACGNQEMVTKLIVADIAPKFYPPHHQGILEALGSLGPEELRSRTAADEALAKKIPDPATRMFLLKNLYRETKEKLSFRCNLGVLRFKAEEIGEAIGATAVYNGPTLFLRGGRSEYVSPEDIPEIKRHFPLASVETIPDTGHWLHAEKPELFFGKSLEFINS